jgi:murein DD-endopeptidase MepM/ murein hydrolase activator NlpD
MHPGVDFSAPPGTPVFPTAAGTVAFAGWHAEYGRVIEIDHGYGIRTRYAHLSRPLVEPGQFVTARQRIGLLGSTGRTTGPHLHYEVMLQGKNVDPAKFMRARDVLQPK